MESSRLLVSTDEDHVSDAEWEDRWHKEDLSPTTEKVNELRPTSWARVSPFIWIQNRLGRRRRRSISPSRRALIRPIRHKCTAVKFATKLALVAVAVFLTLSVCNGLFQPSYANPPQRYLDLEERVKSSTRSGRGNVNNEKVFIAANIINEDLIRGVWGDNLVTLVDLLGEENVFVSIYENDSGNGTSAALRQLQTRLRCNSSVVAGDHLPLSEFPTTRLPNGEERVQRLAYLAEVRNRLLRPLDTSHHHDLTAGFRPADGINFDRILFLNDVYYSPLEAVQLLFSTNAGSGLAQYRAACALDFVLFFKLYDTFVVRDTDGYRVPLQFYPWFTSRGSGTSRRDVLNMEDAVRVRSCWGGMAAFDARVFQDQSGSSEADLPPQPHQPSLKFRSNGEPFWEAAECCLIFADMESQLGKPSKNDGTGVFINPYVRTAYSTTTWNSLPFFKRYEHVFQYFQSAVDFFIPPERNPRRTHEPGQMVDESVWVDNFNSSTTPTNYHYRNIDVRSPHGRFEVQHRAAASGGFCGVRRMFVMMKDVEAANKGGSGKNWEKVRVP